MSWKFQVLNKLSLTPPEVFWIRERRNLLYFSEDSILAKPTHLTFLMGLLTFYQRNQRFPCFFLRLMIFMWYRWWTLMEWFMGTQGRICVGMMWIGSGVIRTERDRMKYMRFHLTLSIWMRQQMWNTSSIYIPQAKSNSLLTQTGYLWAFQWRHPITPLLRLVPLIN